MMRGLKKEFHRVLEDDDDDDVMVKLSLLSSFRVSLLSSENNALRH